MEEKIIYLVEIDGYDPVAAQVKSLRFCTGTGIVTSPTDTPANTTYDPRIVQAGKLRRDCFAEGKTSGESRIYYGETVLNNSAGDLDYLIDWGFDGRKIVVKAGRESWAVSDYVTVFTGTMEQPLFGWNRVTLRVLDRMAELNRPAQTSKYGGTNVLPAGIDGTSDIKGRSKPLVFGRPDNVTPILVNTSKLIYQFNDGTGQVGGVYDRGVVIPNDTPAIYSSQADMEANAPAAGTYRYWPAGGMFRLGSAPAGVITCDASDQSVILSYYPSAKAGAVAKRIATRVISAADVVDADITAIDDVFASGVGLNTAEGQTVKDLLDDLVPAVGAWYGFDRLGQFRLQEMAPPSGTPVVTLVNDDVLSVERLATADGDRGVPVWRVSVEYWRNHTLQTSDVAGSVTADRRNWIGSEYRVRSAQNSTVLTAHPLAPELVIRTPVINSTAYVDWLAERYLDRYEVRRDRLKVRVKISPEQIDLFDLGNVISVAVVRLGYFTGKLFRIIGIELDCSANSMTLDLWG